jgi:hippurate hydrolase
MDALPLREDTGLDFASGIEGAMHACGHDTHVAMLAGAARALSAQREKLNGTVVFMFQPGEEGWHGAKYMLEDGLLDDPRPHAAFALHISPNMPAGLFASRTGPLLASADEFEVKVTGKGGHGAMPHETIDPVPIAAEMVLALQTLVSRKTPPHESAVITVGKIESGTTDNVIPETAILLGTIRTLDERIRTLLHEGIVRVATHVALAHAAKAEVEISPGFPVTVCDGRIVDLAERTATALFGEHAWRTMPTPMMGAEDFSYVLQQMPGAMAFLGAVPEGGDFHSCCGLHSNRMVLDERVMARGVAMHCAMAEAFLNGEAVV